MEPLIIPNARRRFAFLLLSLALLDDPQRWPAQASPAIWHQP